MGPVVLDTSVVVAFLNPQDERHRAAAAEITSRREAGQAMRVSAITVAELASISGPGRKSRVEIADRLVDALGPDGVISIDRRVAQLAGDTCAKRPSLKLADALIKASADSVGGELLTADRKLASLGGVQLLGSRR